MESTLRSTARMLFDHAVDAADPARAVGRGLASNPPPEVSDKGRVFLIAVGKAAPAMLGAAQEVFPDAHLALAVTHHENEAEVSNATLLKAGHPVPDSAGFEATRHLIAVLDEANADDLIVALISGGGSALLPAPPDGVSLDDKAKLNSLLLASGLDIVQMNMIRQQVSELKGGGFLRHAAPARVCAYLLSDVIGDDLRAIASGPTVGPIGTPTQAVELLQKLGVWDEVPESIKAHLTREAEDLELPEAQNVLVGSNRLSLDAMLTAARRAGLDASVVDDALTGDVGDAAAKVAAMIAPVSKPTALLFGGETTVKLTGTGRGGRNQELALRVAMNAPKMAQNWVFLSGGTDGRDGPTDAAGGVVDAGTRVRIVASGENPDALLANNDSYKALGAAGDLLMTAATGTNVADVQVLLIEP